jgi:ParB/RepB/Spo0J family partition protein
MGLKRLEAYDTYEIPVAEIYYDPDFNCRSAFTPQSCIELAESIRDKGLQFPLVVQPAQDVPEIPEGFRYRLVAGHRRFIAIKIILRLPLIAASIRHGLTPEDARVINLIENIARRDLTFWEEAVALRKTFQGYNLSQISRSVNQSLRWVEMRWKVFDMPLEVQKKIQDGVLKSSDIKYLTARNSQEQQVLGLEMAIAKEHGESTRSIVKRLGLVLQRRSISEIEDMIAYLYSEGIAADSCKALLWSTGKLSKEDFLSDPY